MYGAQLQGYTRASNIEILQKMSTKFKIIRTITFAPYTNNFSIDRGFKIFPIKDEPVTNPMVSQEPFIQKLVASSNTSTMLMTFACPSNGFDFGKRGKPNGTEDKH